MTTDAQARQSGHGLSALTTADRDRLFEAASLIRDVRDRHPLEMHGSIITAVQACVHDIDVLGRYLEAAEAVTTSPGTGVEMSPVPATVVEREWAAQLYRGEDEPTPYCNRCDFDTHQCHGCGEPLAHGVEVCESCQADLDVGAALLAGEDVTR